MLRPLAVLLIVLFDVCAVSALAENEPTVRIHIRQHHRWAAAIPLAGAPNFNLHRVAHDFYRSAQPDEQEFRALVKQYGVRTVISLRAYHSDEPLTQGLRLRLLRIGMHTWHIEHEDVVVALHTLRIAMRQGPTLLHCEHGADRTGLITALYRILYQGWSKQEAIDEIEHGGFGFHDMWINIPWYIQELNVDQLKREIGSENWIRAYRRSGRQGSDVQQRLRGAGQRTV